MQHDGREAGSAETVSPQRWRRVAAHRLQILGTARRLTSSHADAEDVVQEALIRAAQHDDLDEQRAEQFLHTVVRRLCADLYRRRARDDRVLREAELRPYIAPSPEEAVCDQAEALQLAAAVAHLDVWERSLVRHRAEGRSYRQIASELDTTEGAIKSAFLRLRRRLRSVIDGTSH